jgi:hypothetical protein
MEKGDSEGIIEGGDEMEGPGLAVGAKEGCMDFDGFIEGTSDGISLGMEDSDGMKLALGAMDAVGIVVGLRDSEGNKVGETVAVGKGEGLPEANQLGEAEGFKLYVGLIVALSMTVGNIVPLPVGSCAIL